ncbi:MAG: CDP-diacylglycerol--glycerol-3-phosphate 3-phosphatidyltransferase [Bacilli bacterium]|jgi:CDP-diacylglycerol--glycerol-3-phosphate 3-phosphatidyltransferase|nr:CDP-diacylglycerol--glycerol-3-phosphate 3-phosphatidyltransferase [Bacilli bacterium]
MNLPNKLSLFRVILTFIIIIILTFPFYTVNIEFPLISIEGIIMDTKYIIAGIIFAIASLTDTLDGYIARKYNLITDYGKMLDAIADKILVNSVLIILSGEGFIHPIIPVIIITRDTITNTIKMMAGNKGKVVAAMFLGKVKAACLMVGIILILFYNMPFSLYNLRVADFLLVMAAVLSVISMIQYYNINKRIIFSK